MELVKRKNYKFTIIYSSKPLQGQQLPDELVCKLFSRLALLDWFCIVFAVRLCFVTRDCYWTSLSLYKYNSLGTAFPFHFVSFVAQDGYENISKGSSFRIDCYVLSLTSGTSMRSLDTWIFFVFLYLWDLLLLIILMVQRLETEFIGVTLLRKWKRKCEANKCRMFVNKLQR